VKSVPGPGSRDSNVTLRGHLAVLLMRLPFGRLATTFRLATHLAFAIHRGDQDSPFYGPPLQIRLINSGRQLFWTQDDSAKRLLFVRTEERERGFFVYTEKAPLIAVLTVNAISIGLRLGYGLKKISRPAALLPEKLTGTAVFLAGKERGTLADEWKAHLAGWSGAGLSRQAQLRAAFGFLGAAVRFRLEDAADLAWRPADAVLGSRILSNLFVWGPVVATIFAIVRHDGRFGLVADDQDPVALGAFLYVVIKTGRWWRQIKLPEPKPRRVKE